MPIDSILAYAATTGAMAAVAPTNLTIKQNGHIVAYALDGTDAASATITNTLNDSWDPAGFTLPVTSQSSILPGKAMIFLKHKIPVNKADVLTITSVNAAAAAHLVLWLDYGSGFQVRGTDQPEARYVTRASVAQTAVCAAGTFVGGNTNVTNFPSGKGGRIYTLIGVNCLAAMTTTFFVGLRKAGSSYMLVVPVSSDAIINTWPMTMDLPLGVMDTVSKGDGIEVFLSSITGERPTVNLTFAY